jgi:hypothetical protein
MKLKLTKKDKWQLRMLPFVWSLVAAEIYFCIEKMLIPACIGAIILFILNTYRILKD